MSYTALYRRFRPQTFAELVGQPHISRTLAVAVKKGSFVHAYLFCGPRGTGKTSTAKILARAVNCLNPAEGGPCGECAACLRSFQGESLDILEIDAASNRGIDEIRDLRERVKYAPAQEKYKVYIIDEVHMLTAPAFNALLKTLEEPPGHVLFILATTEPHKIPLTVLSRCQRFDFRRIADSDVEAHLAHVAAAEGYTAAPEALALIARKVEGGLRDALSLLDQCAGAGNGQITVETLQLLTGAVDRDFIAAVTRHMLAGDAAALLTMVAQLHAGGQDLRQFLHDLLEYQRELLLLKLSPAAQPAPSAQLSTGARPPAAVKLSPAAQPDLPEWAATASPARLLKLLSALADGDGRLRSSLQPRLTLELALLNACGVTEADSESPGRPVTSPTPPVGVNQRAKPAQTTPAAEVKQRAKPGQTTPVEVLTATPPLAKKSATAAADQDGELEQLKQLWPQVVREVSLANNSTGAFLAQAQPLALSRDKLTIGFGDSYALFMDNICRPGPARTLVEQKLAALSGRVLVLEGVLQPAESVATAPETEQESLF